MTTAALVVMSASIGSILLTFLFCLIKVMTSPAESNAED